MNPDDVVASIDRHFAAGCGFIDARQLRSHQVIGQCPECIARLRMAADQAKVLIPAT